MTTKASILLAAALTLATVTPSAGATVATGRDHAHGARFSMTSKTLTVTLTRPSDVRRVAGAMIGVNCVSRRPPANGAFALERWPAHSRRLVVYGFGVEGPRPVRCAVDVAEPDRRAFHIAALLW